MPKTLVAFHSRGGSTRRIAEEIADAVGGDLEEIVALCPSAGFGCCCAMAWARWPAPARRSTDRG